MDNPKILILCAKLNIGGAQLAAANISRFSGGRFRCHYIVFGDEVGEYEQEILDRGDLVFHYPSPKQGFAAFLRRLYAQMKRERYLAVHCHTLHNCGLVMPAALLAGVPCRISHSHTTKEECAESLPRKVYRSAMRTLIRLFSTEYFACGTAAGHTLYGKGWFDRRGTVIPNGIDAAAYGFSPENRALIRRRYELGDRFVVGHVGHYVPVKNQSFLIRLMPRLLQLRPDAVLLLFGEGEDRAALAALIDELELSDSVRLMGNVRNIRQVLSAFDVFVFPSLFEGTPLALLEAQANGLPCLISEAIPDDACLTDDIRRLPSNPQDWAKAIAGAKRTALEDRSHILLQHYESIHDSMARIYGVMKTYHNNR